MKDERKYIVFCLVAFICAAVGGYLAGWDKGRDSGWNEPEIVTDTLITRDTVYIDSPVPVTTIPSGYEMVKIGTVKQLKDRLAALEADADYWACNPDTVWLSMPLPIEQKRYGGDGYDYEAAVSGYHPNLDYIKVFPKTVTITTTQTVTKPVPPKWSISPFAGVDIGHETFAARMGVLYDRQLHGGLRIWLGGGYELRNTGVLQQGAFVAGGVKLELLKQ